MPTNDHARAAAEPCRPDTDAQDPASGYPKTANDILHLLSCYWADMMTSVEFEDSVYAAWERQARPVIERLTAALADVTKERDALLSQLKSAGHAPYLERMSELAKRAEAAEKERDAALHFWQSRDELRAEVERRDAEYLTLRARYDEAKAMLSTAQDAACEALSQVASLKELLALSVKSDVTVLQALQRRCNDLATENGELTAAITTPEVYHGVVSRVLEDDLERTRAEVRRLESRLEAVRAWTPAMSDRRAQLIEFRFRFGELTEAEMKELDQLQEMFGRYQDAIAPLPGGEPEKGGTGE